MAESFDNPFNPTNPDRQTQTPPLDQTMRQAIEFYLYNLNTWLPCKVAQVRGVQKVDLQPLVKRRYADGSLADLPAIQNCMVVMTRGADYSIKVPVKEGDTGIALFCQRSLDIWGVQGGSVDPKDIRHHDLQDAVFIPGLYPFSDQLTDDTDDIVVTNGDAEFHVQKDGKFLIKNQTQELLDLLDQLLNTLINDTYTMTLLGPQKFIASTQLLLTVLRTKLDTLKGS